MYPSGTLIFSGCDCVAISLSSWILLLYHKGTIATQSQPLKINIPEGYIKPKTLSSIGITLKESSIYKTIASIPDEIFEMETVTENETVTKDEKRKPKVKTDFIEMWQTFAGFHIKQTLNNIGLTIVNNY